MVELFKNDFFIIFISGNKGYYSSALLDFIEFSPIVARYIANKCNQDEKTGCKLINFIGVKRNYI